MVVVFVTHNYPRHAGDLAGNFLPPLARALSERGHDVRVVAPAEQGRGGRVPLDGIPVRRVRYAEAERETLAYGGRMLEAVRSPSGLLAFVGMLRALRQGARAEAEASTGRVVVHAHWWVPAGLALPTEWPGLITLHGTDGRLFETSAVARWLGRWALRRAKVVSAVSPELAAVVERVAGRRDVASHVQPMPIDSSNRPWSRGGGGAIVVSRLTAQKRVDLAIAAVAELGRSAEPVSLTIIGDGPERATLEAAAARLGGGASVAFAGSLPPDEVAQRLAVADVMLFPAVAEGLGLAAIEGLVAGVPVIACSDGGGVVSALGRFGGGIVTNPSPRALASAMRDANTPERKAAARRAGEQWRAELAPPRVAEVFEGWYREALDA